MPKVLLESIEFRRVLIIELIRRRPATSVAKPGASAKLAQGSCVLFYQLALPIFHQQTQSYSSSIEKITGESSLLALISRW